MRRSAAALLACSTATALTALEEPWLHRALRPEDESISKKKAGQKGVAGGPCYPGKTECPFSTSCEWGRDSEDGSRAVWKSTSASGAPDNSSLSHFPAMTRPSWLGRAVRNRHRHAIEQASRRWRGGRRDDAARTRRKILISTQVPFTIPIHDLSQTGAPSSGRTLASSMNN